MKNLTSINSELKNQPDKQKSKQTADLSYKNSKGRISFNDTSSDSWMKRVNVRRRPKMILLSEEGRINLICVYVLVKTPGHL